MSDPWMNERKVLALEALAEQQRAANQIAVLSNAARGVAEGLVHIDDYMTLFHQLNPQVMEAMGLGKEADDD